MKIYKEDPKTIFLSQFRDPLMDHLYKKILLHLGKSSGKKLLDIGCGVGKVAFLAAEKGFEVTGVEIEEKAAKLAEKNLKRYGSKTRIITGDILKIKLKENYFDAVVCSEVIEHVNNPQQIINRIFKLLKKGGLLVLTTPHNQKYWTVSDEYADHKKRFSIKEVKNLLFDFKITDLYTVGFPGMVSLVLSYNFLVRFLKIKHNASWRKKRLTSSLYYFLAVSLLKFDDLFNRLNLGLDLIIVARKD